MFLFDCACMTERYYRSLRRLERIAESTSRIGEFQDIQSDSEEEEVQSNLPHPNLMEQQRDNMAQQANLVEENQRMSIRDYAAPKRVGDLSCIRRPPIDSTNFEIKPITISLLNNVQFGGLANEDPNLHISSFLEVCELFRYNGVSDDAVRLRLFPFTLRDKAKGWLHSLLPGTITTWCEMETKFLNKFFPPAKTAKLRNEINTFYQYDQESLYEAWERFKELLRKCHHHGMELWNQVQTFYNGLNGAIRNNLDAAAGGVLLSKTQEEAYELIEEMACNSSQWSNERNYGKKVMSIQEEDKFSTINAQLATLTKQMGKMMSTSNPQPYECCDFCGEGHEITSCPLGNPTSQNLNANDVNFVGNYQRQ